MSLWTDIQPWIDKSTGLMTAADGGRDNLVLMSVYLLRELKRSQNYADASDQYGIQMLSQDIYQFLDSCKVAYGLYRREPNDLIPNSIDNLIATCYVHPTIAEDIRQRWNFHLSCFDVNRPNKFAFNQNFFGRFFGIKAYIDAAAGKKPWLIQRLFWCASTLFSIKFNDGGASGPLLSSLQCDIMEKYCPKTVAYWRMHYSVKYLYSQYFGPNFPLTLYARD